MAHFQELVDTLKQNNESITFDDVRTELQEGKYNVNIKEDDNLCLIYYQEQTDGRDPLVEDFGNNTRSLVIEKATLLPLGSQYNNIIYNDDAVKHLRASDWTKVQVQRCIEGTLVLVYCHEGTWHVSTRRCLDAADSKWVDNTSYKVLFEEAMHRTFDYNDLNSDYCYHFVLVHHQNRNLVEYNLGHDYRELYHILTTEKYTLNVVNSEINDKVQRVVNIDFESLDELLKKLDELSRYDVTHNRLTTEGFVIKLYDGEVNNSPFKVFKLQTEIYQRLAKLKPNNSNIHQNFLELYQTNNLAEFLPFYTKHRSAVVKRISTAMHNMAEEMLKLYHLTRKQKNPTLYNGLTAGYRRILFKLHGVYIGKQNKFTVGRKENASLNVHDVYYFLKDLSPSELRELFYDRMVLLDDSNNRFINRKCNSTLTQSVLMFHNRKKN